MTDPDDYLAAGLHSCTPAKVTGWKGVKKTNRELIEKGSNHVAPPAIAAIFFKERQETSSHQNTFLNKWEINGTRGNALLKKQITPQGCQEKVLTLYTTSYQQCVSSTNSNNMGTGKFGLWKVSYMNAKKYNTWRGRSKVGRWGKRRGDCKAQTYKMSFFKHLRKSQLWEGGKKTRVKKKKY